MIGDIWFGIFSEFKYGNCKLWLDASAMNASSSSSSEEESSSSSGESSSSSEQLCSSCRTMLSCASCLEQLGCGWCYSEENPTLGSCMEGNFLSPTGNAALDRYGYHVLSVLFPTTSL
jgi:Plexin repeat